MWQAIICTNADSTHWHIYAALGGDELTHWFLGDLDGYENAIFELI